MGGNQRGRAHLGAAAMALGWLLAGQAAAQPAKAEDGTATFPAAFFAQYNYRVDPPMVMSLDMSMKFVLITILGGLGTFWGPLLGAAVLIPLQEYTRAYLAHLGSGVDLIIFGLIIIFTMIRQPTGIMGLIRRFALRDEDPAAKDGDL